VHDIADLESRGLPGVFAASREFDVAAAAQSDALGFPAAVVFVDHPVQDRTDDEMRALADGVFPALIEAITRSSTPPKPDRP
jgi:hypothetical protein